MVWAELPQIFRLIAALAFVVALMGGLAYVLRRTGLSGPMAGGKNSRLKVVETQTLDARRRLVLIQRDDVEHLVILGPAGETVVETGIKPVQTEGSSKGKREPVL